MNKRVGFLDEIRGFAIICMVVYHAMYLLKTFYNINVPLFFTDWFDIIRDIFAGLFIFVSGISCQYSRNNLKRGVQCFFIGMMITYVTAVIVPKSVVLFGILHFLGIAMMLYGLGQKLFERVPAFIGFLASVFLFIFTMSVKFRHFNFFGLLKIGLPSNLYDAGFLFPLGMFRQGFTSSDYFPLLPWFFLFLAGAYFGYYVKENYLPRFMYNVNVPPLAAVGRHTLLIYVLHQPILALIFSLIFGKSIF